MPRCRFNLLPRKSALKPIGDGIKQNKEDEKK